MLSGCLAMVERSRSSRLGATLMALGTPLARAVAVPTPELGRSGVAFAPPDPDAGSRDVGSPAAAAALGEPPLALLLAPIAHVDNTLTYTGLTRRGSQALEKRRP